MRPRRVREVGDGVVGEERGGGDVLAPAVAVVAVHLLLDPVQPVKLLADEGDLRLRVEPLRVRVHRHHGDGEEAARPDLDAARPLLLPDDVVPGVGHVDDLLVRLVPDLPDADGLEGGVVLDGLDRPASARRPLVLLVPRRLG